MATSHLQTSLKLALERKYPYPVHIAEIGSVIQVDGIATGIVIPRDITGPLIVGTIDGTHRVFFLTREQIREGKPVTLKDTKLNKTRCHRTLVDLSNPNVKVDKFIWPPGNNQLYWPGSVPIPDELSSEKMEQHMAWSIQATAEWSLFELLNRPDQLGRDMVTVYNIPNVALGDMLFARLVLPYAKQPDTISEAVAETIVRKHKLHETTFFSWHDTSRWKGLNRWAAAGALMANTFVKYCKTEQAMDCTRAIAKHRTNPMFGPLTKTPFFAWLNNSHLRDLPWGDIFEQMRLDFGRFFIGMSPKASRKQHPFNLDMFYPANQWVKTLFEINRLGQNNNPTKSILAWANLAVNMSRLTKQSLVCQTWIDDIQAKHDKQQLEQSKRITFPNQSKWKAPTAETRRARYSDMEIPDIETFLERYVSGPHIPPCLKDLFQHAQQAHHLCDADRMTIRSVVTHFLPNQESMAEHLATWILGYGHGGPIDRGAVEELKGQLVYSYQKPQKTILPSCQTIIDRSREADKADPTKTNPKVSIIRCPFSGSESGDVKSACTDCMRKTGPPKNAIVYRPTDRLLHLHETGQLEW